jgi:exopolysaccharide biosynthesis polyprenyl glycosylphosphotransferase
MLVAVVFSRQKKKLRPLLALGDIFVFWAAFQAAYWTRSQLTLQFEFYFTPPVYALLQIAAIGFGSAAGWWTGALDRSLTSSASRLAADAFRQAAFATICLILFQYTQRLDVSRPFFAFLFVFSALGLCAFRTLARQVAARRSSAPLARRVIWIAGSSPAASRIAAQLENGRKFGLWLEGFVGAGPPEGGRAGYRSIAWEGLPHLLSSEVVDEMIFAVDIVELGKLEDTLLLCDELGVRTRIALDIFPHAHSLVDLERLEGEPLLTFSAAPHDRSALLIKRAADILLSSAALILLSPLLLAIAFAVALTSEGGAIFRQRRCGLNGRIFTLFKFRTMHADAERRREEVEHLNVKRLNFKIPNDPRLTPLGRWLRKFSLDELPQLWNVLRGEMSLVGPRPAIPEEVQQYQRWQRRRLRMRPGLTCLWALEGRDELDVDEVMRLDLAYIDKWSLPLDWSIMIRTVPVVLTGKGAH